MSKIIKRAGQHEILESPLGSWFLKTPNGTQHKVTIEMSDEIAKATFIKMFEEDPEDARAKYCN